MNFSDEKIASMADRLGLDLDDGKVRDILRYPTSCDVQACPGSGKTSLLSAKLSLIAATRDATNRAVCVLSHTNVARDEIERRLRMTSEGQRFLHVPHFIGTIQSFVNTFLATPYLRSKKIPFESIDNARHATLAKRYFAELKYVGARTWLSKQHIGMDVGDFAGDLEFDGSLNRIRHCSLTLPSETSTTYKSLLDVKRRVAANGIYRYHDMFAVAHAYLDEFPWITSALRLRFPIVFIDEVQDTSKLQFDVLNRVFDRDAHIVQRFGDSDQAIYEGLYEADEDAKSDFPRDPILSLDSSRRFGPFIAGQVAALSLSSQPILGKGNVQQGKNNSIFLFDDTNVTSVLPAFGDLVLSEFDGEAVLANAIGRRRKPGTGKRIPTSIGDYWAEYDSSAYGAPAASSGMFVDAVAGALSVLLAGDSYHDAMMPLWRGLGGWAKALGAADTAAVIRSVKTDVLSRSAVGAALYGLVKSGSFPEKVTWDQCTAAIEEALISAINGKSGAPPSGFATYPQTMPTIELKGRQTYEHRVGERAVFVEMNTIHGVKSQTHSATLLLETSINNSFDLKNLIPYLSGRKSLSDGGLKAGTAAAVRCGFVAISRPQSLLCLAIKADHVSAPDRKRLQDRGWNIVDLTGVAVNGAVAS